MQPKEDEKKDKMKQKKKHNEMKEMYYICHSHMLLNQHEARNEASRVRIRELRQSLPYSDRNEKRGNNGLRMQINRLNQLVQIDRIAFQYNSKIEYSLHPVVVVERQHNDARMNLAIIITAARLGANVANHVAVTELLKKPDENGKEKVCGARVKDQISGKEWVIHAKSVINATGPFTDSIRKMDDQKCPVICQPSAGVHIVLPAYYSPDNMGLLDPATSDGRVIFFLPWQKMTIAGTTDRPCEVTHHPSPTEDEIQFILNEVKNYLTPEITVRRGDVMSVWSGIRPLVLNPNKGSTEALARNHVLHVSDSNLVTIAGGKWTTYRVMAKEAVDAAVETCKLNPNSECQTDGLLLEGASGWTPNMYIRLVQDYGLESEVAQHLANTYGDRAFTVAKHASLTGKRWPIIGRRLHEEYPYIEAEVRYAVHEYACTAVDVIARRLRLSFLNVQATEEALPSIISIMAEELNWSKSKQKVRRNVVQ
ncbi:Glycerol-3-phosphate dehydrogenase, mitochondrial [Araneus ventricosus]|uniref:glycerol-3-phosphate dehydrogenase n=1 Tax=Araneus ventricosus TaxID=182803 RepID=A0A4Y2QC14_ARAVE|nr:Glycerol-3-phosphate dehydrogenase, mitochondrial [Araneus ventricosus]